MPLIKDHFHEVADEELTIIPAPTVPDTFAEPVTFEDEVTFSGAATFEDTVEFQEGVTFAGDVLFTNLPTADPEVAGQLWSDAGVVTVSAGA